MRATGCKALIPRHDYQPVEGSPDLYRCASCGRVLRAEVVTFDVAPLRCAWCEEERPSDSEPCPHCGNARFPHKTENAHAFWERQREIREHNRAEM